MHPSPRSSGVLAHGSRDYVCIDIVQRGGAVISGFAIARRCGCPVRARNRPPRGRLDLGAYGRCSGNVRATALLVGPECRRADERAGRRRRRNRGNARSRYPNEQWPCKNYAPKGSALGGLFRGPDDRRGGPLGSLLLRRGYSIGRHFAGGGGAALSESAKSTGAFNGISLLPSVAFSAS